ncbi:MAG: hypothetical protein ACFFAU_05880 [Candidatus Hodarchaeota archaeon]
MKSEEKEILLLLTQFARRPGLSIYHYAVLTTLDENNRPYSRIRSPTVNKPYDLVMEDIEKQLSGKTHTRYSKEQLEKAKALDTKYKDIIDEYAWHILCYDETVQDKSRKTSIKHLEHDPKASMVFMEAKVIIDPKSGKMTYQRGTKDIIMDIEVSNISRRGEPLFEHRSQRYLLLLADTHLASYENKEEQFYSTVFEIWTAKPINIKLINQKEGGPIELLEDFVFTNKEESLMFLKKHNMGTIAIKDPDTQSPFAIPTEFSVDQSIAEGVFWIVDSSQEFIVGMYKKVIRNVDNNEPYVSICTPAFGTQYELGIAIEGDMVIKGKEIDNFRAKTGFDGPIVYINPRRITNISPSEKRRKTINIVYNEWN